MTNPAALSPLYLYPMSIFMSHALTYVIISHWYSDMADNNQLPTVRLTCKKCGLTFECEQRILWERAGKATCSHCDKESVYNFGDIKKD